MRKGLGKSHFKGMKGMSKSKGKNGFDYEYFSSSDEDDYYYEDFKGKGKKKMTLVRTRSRKMSVLLATYLFRADPEWVIRYSQLKYVVNPYLASNSVRPSTRGLGTC